MKKLLLVQLLLTITFLGCRKDNPTTSTKPTPTPTTPKSSTKVINSFGFKVGTNPGKINQDILGAISNQTIEITLPNGTDISSLIPTISYTGKSINPDSNTAQNYTSPKIYTVQAEDSSTIQYTVNVHIAALTTNAAINTTIKYATAADGSDLSINIQAPEMPIGATRPLIVFTHGTGSAETNGLSIHGSTAALLAQGFVVANFNFYGSDNTKNLNDGKHLFDQYPMVLNYLKQNAALYHININAIILCGQSGSGAMAIHTALKSQVFGCFLECSGMTTGYDWDRPATLPATLSFGGIQTRSDLGFGGYKYSLSDAMSGNSHNGATWSENTSLIQPDATADGDCKYCTAWEDCGLVATQNFMTAKYLGNFKIDNNGASYIKVIEGSNVHCGGTGWADYVNATPKRMLNDRGITW